MTEKLMPYLADPLTMALLGLLAHFLMDMIRIRKEEGKFLNLFQYWWAFPAQSMICLIGLVAGLVMLHGMGSLTPVDAFGVGYISNSLADKIGNRTGAKLDV